MRPEPKILFLAFLLSFCLPLHLFSAEGSNGPNGVGFGSDLSQIMAFIRDGSIERAKAEITIRLDVNPNDPEAPLLRELQRDPEGIYQQYLRVGKGAPVVQQKFNAYDVEGARRELKKLVEENPKVFELSKEFRFGLGTFEDLTNVINDPAVFKTTAIVATRQNYERMACKNNLKQIGLAIRVWALDNQDRYPFAVPGANGGTMELRHTGANGYDDHAFKHFIVLSNELNTPKILVCPSDTNKTIAANFSSLGAENISYQLRSGPEISDEHPNEILARCPIHHHILRCDGSVMNGSREDQR
jgi:hypothetical protein